MTDLHVWRGGEIRWVLVWRRVLAFMAVERGGVRKWVDGRRLMDCFMVAEHLGYVCFERLDVDVMSLMIWRDDGRGCDGLLHGFMSWFSCR